MKPSGLMSRVGLAVALVASTSSRAQTQAAAFSDHDVAAYARASIAGLDYDQARRALAEADSADPEVALERARLAVYEMDCDGAAAIMARTDVQKVEGGDAVADIARGCQRVTAAVEADTDDARGIEVLWQDEHDRALAPLLFDTVAKARDALSRDLGVDWPKPTRLVIVRDLLSLSAMTGLPYKASQTTGTVAVAKWGRVTLLSPRASRHGFAWRDTIAHELAHLAVTRASQDRAPLWLQEGIAKNEEVRWRSAGPFDDRPPPEALAERGKELGLTLPLDKLGPSIAMLPSADAATVAFAEVTSFVRFYVQTGQRERADGDEALRALLRELRAGKTPDAALVAASGADLKEWDERWRAFLASRSHAAPLQSFDIGGHGRGDAPGTGDALRELRDRSRLAQLLMARGHAGEALAELGRIEPRGPAADASTRGVEELSGADPSALWLRARALEEVGRRADAERLLGDPKQVLSAFGPWWAARGRAARLRGDEGVALESFSEAVAADPFDSEVACETVDPAEAPVDRDSRALCDAARARAEPAFDGE